MIFLTPIWHLNVLKGQIQSGSTSENEVHYV